VVSLDIATAADLQRFREQIWKSDRHVILQGLLAKELNAIQPVMADRKNFSIMPIDWWSSPFWFSQHATFNIFHNYNGIMVRSSRASLVAGSYPPWFYLPQRRLEYEIQSALLRPAALLTAPLVELINWRRRATATPARMVYFPFPIAEVDVPRNEETPQHDFTSMGATMGTWLMRDPYVPASLSFANLYADRQRLINLIGEFDGRPYRVFDRRRNDKWLPWEELTRIIRQSQFMVCTGGLHRNSIVKFLEYACLGVPMIGSVLPFEYPWLDLCMVAVDPMRITSAELKVRLAEAVEQYPTLRRNCLAVRDTLLKLYHPDTLLDMLQEQMSGGPVRPGYLKDGVQRVSPTMEGTRKVSLS